MPEAGACSTASQSLSLGLYFPGIFLQSREHLYQGFADHGVVITFWRHGIHYMALLKGVQDISETQKISWEWHFRWCGWDFQLNILQYIQSGASWISRYEIFRKVTSSSNSNQANFQEQTIFYLGKSGPKVRRTDYRKASQLFRGSCLGIIFDMECNKPVTSLLWKWIKIILIISSGFQQFKKCSLKTTYSEREQQECLLDLLGTYRAVEIQNKNPQRY